MDLLMKDDSSDEFGPDCMCELCMKYGWHDSAPWYVKLYYKLFKGR